MCAIIIPTLGPDRKRLDDETLLTRGAHLVPTGSENVNDGTRLRMEVRPNSHNTAAYNDSTTPEQHKDTLMRGNGANMPLKNCAPVGACFD